jgi:hypothetical protein
MALARSLARAAAAGIELLLLGALLLPLRAPAEDNQAAESSLETAFHDVLAHGDRSDLDFLSKSLGLTFELTQPESIEPGGPRETRVRVIGVPPYLVAGGLSYDLGSRAADGTTSIYLRFQPRQCLPLSKWAKGADTP